MAIAGLTVFATGAGAQSAADFYRGKTITLVTGSSGNGSYDLVAEAVAQFLPQYMPGNPSAVIQSMPGASHVRATEYLNNIAPRDGTVLGFLQPYIVLNKILNPTTRYRPEELTWISRLLPLIQVGFVWHTVGVGSIDQAKQRSLSFGAEGATGPAATVPWALNRMIGTKFRIVRGYPGDAPEFLAIQRGELDGLGSAQWGFLVHQPGFIDQHWIVPLYVIGLQRLKDFPNVPTIVDLAPSKLDREIMRILATMPAIGTTVTAPPGVPQDRVGALREAIAKVAQDPGFRSAMGKLDMDVDPLSGPEVAKLVSQSMQATPEMVKELQNYTAPED
jgi:tripartite-type tricarboxylate transporter receptor subunit TctC